MVEPNDRIGVDGERRMVELHAQALDETVSKLSVRLARVARKLIPLEGKTRELRDRVRAHEHQLKNRPR